MTIFLKTSSLFLSADINWQQSLLDGSIQFIFTVLIAFIISHYSSKKSDGRKLKLDNLNQLDNLMFQIKEVYEGVISNILTLSDVSDTAKDEDRGNVYVTRSKISNYYSIGNELDIMKIKINSIIEVLESKKTNIDKFKNDIQRYISMTEYLLNILNNSLTLYEEYDIYIVGFEYTESGNVFDQSDYFKEILFEVKSYEDEFPFSEMYKDLVKSKSLYL